LARARTGRGTPLAAFPLDIDAGVWNLNDGGDARRGMRHPSRLGRRSLLRPVRSGTAAESG